MTRDQMHNTLRYVREQLADERGEDYSGVMALDMVLEELEQEPTPNDDYFRKMAGVVISQLRADRDRLEDELAKREQEPCEKDWRFYYDHGYAQAKRDLSCEDAIGRQAVMDCYKKWQPYMATRLWDFEKELSKLPPVNPQEPKTGHWIKPYGGNWHCDKCDHEQGKKSNYCPNCGARMIEPQESEDKE